MSRHYPAPTDVVVDLGCGSGEFSALMASLVPQRRVIGVDADPSMLESAARRAAPNLEFVESSAERLDEVVAEASADLVVSLLNRIAAEHGVPPTPPFPDAGTVFDLVDAAGFDLPGEGVRTVAQRRSFTRDTLTALLRDQAAVALTRHTSEGVDDALVPAVAGGVDQLRRGDGTYDQTFVRLEILARRPD